MPTGYTADICDGKNVSLKDFAMDCARAFTPFARIQEDSDGDENAVSEQVASRLEWFKRNIEEEEKEIEKINAIPDEEISQIIRKQRTDEISHITENIIKVKDLKQRYENMLKQVVAWNPPTEKHNELKNFMISQLEKSIEFDCKLDYYEEWLQEVLDKNLATVEEYKQTFISTSLKSIDRYKEKIDKENSQLKNNVEWIKELRESFDNQ